jgi:lysophospholipase L1-like esterase
MENPCKIIFFGDSITRECTPLFEKVLRKKYTDQEIEIINAGVIGDTSRTGLKRIAPFLDKSPQVVVIGFGMNDWRKEISKQEFKENISKMVDKFNENETRVILLTINPDHQGFFKGTSKEVDEYNYIIREIARKKRIKIADVNSLWKKKIRPPQRGLRDHIHPNRKGYEVFCESLLHVVPQSHTVILWQYNGRECKCNYNCPYCYYALSPKVEDYFFGKIEQWHHAFKEAFGSQKLIFYLAFGEPMLGKSFYDVVSMIEQEPKWNLRITTNLSQNLEKLLNTNLSKEGRLNINASFHPTQITIEKFLKQLFFLREHGIEAPVVYVMWPPHLKRFESDFKVFHKHNFLVHVRRFKGLYKGKLYPEAYSDQERQFIARYCDDGTIKYMLNEKFIFDRRTYAGLHFFIVDCTGNIGYDSDCFGLYTKYRTIFGNILQPHTLRIPLHPTRYPEYGILGTVDGVSNYLKLDYHQLEGNNVLSFAKQGGVYHTKNEVFYKNINKDFNNAKIRAEYYFPPRSIKEKYFVFRSRVFRKSLLYLAKRAKQFVILLKRIYRSIRNRLKVIKF